MDAEEVYTARRRWSLEAKRAIVDEAFSAGSVLAIAKKHGIQAQQIYRWRERVDAMATEGRPTFARVALSASASGLPAEVTGMMTAPRTGTFDAAAARVRVAVILPDGVRIRFYEGTATDDIAGLISALQRARR